MNESRGSEADEEIPEKKDNNQPWHLPGRLKESSRQIYFSYRLHKDYITDIF
jgi:hypothetical protein